MRMSSSVACAEQPRSPVVDHGAWRERIRQRSRLARQDDLSAHLAELIHIRDLAAAAREIVAAGWAQEIWFVHRGEHGRPLSVDLPQARRMTSVPVAEACLVGAILHAGGGLANADTQLVQRTFDLTWHVLHGGGHEVVRWCPGPPVRAQHLRDLVRWNDHPDRTRGEVEGLLRSVERAAEVQRSHARLPCA